jgi:hypothetical protein
MAGANMRSRICGGSVLRRRRVIDRTIAGLTGYWRFTLRYKRKPGQFLAFVIPVTAITC